MTTATVTKIILLISSKDNMTSKKEQGGGYPHFHSHISRESIIDGKQRFPQLRFPQLLVIFHPVDHKSFEINTISEIIREGIGI